MTTSAPVAPSPAGTQSGIQRSRRAIAAFVEHQERWLTRAEQARREGYCAEAVTLCQTQLHVLFRRHLWVKAQLHALSLKPSAWDDNYLFDLLSSPEHDLMRGAKDEQIYGAAQSFDVLTEEEGQALHRRMRAFKNILDRLVAESSPGQTDEELASLAEEYLETTRLCLARFMKDVREFERRIGEIVV